MSINDDIILEEISESLKSIAESLNNLANPLMKVEMARNLTDDKTGTAITPVDGRYLSCMKAEACGSLCKKIPFMKCEHWDKGHSDD